MSSVTLKNNSFNFVDSSELSGNFLSAIPNFRFEKRKWSTARTLNVESVVEHWKENPNSVAVFEDPKVRDMQMVMLRKDHFEPMLKLLHDLQNGQAIIQQDIGTILDAICVAKALAEKQENQIEELKPVAKALNVIWSLTSRIKSTIFIKPSGFQVKPVEMSPEEKKILEEDNAW